MSKRDWTLFVEDIIEAINKIHTYIDKMDLSDFKEDSKTSDAVIRNFEIIGEATRHIPDAIQRKYKQIKWRQIIALRNMIAHEYFGIDLNIAWEIIKKHLPSLLSDMKFLYNKESSR